MSSFSLSGYTGMLKSDMISKKMNEAIAQMTFSKEGPKGKDTVIIEEKTQTIISTIQNMRLQSPAVHTGIVFTFTSLGDKPFPIDVGMHFKWLHMQQGIPVTVRTDDPRRNFYLPSIDDVGSKISVQIDDDCDEAMSRYLESDVINLDPAICTIGESVLREKFYKVLDVDVAFGPETSTKNEIENPSISSACLVMDGLSSIEIDTRGIFMALPVSSDLIDLDNSKLEKRSKKKSSSFISMGSHISPGASSTLKKKIKKETNNEAKMILHIPASDEIKVTCAQPASLIISIPLQRGPPQPSPMDILLPSSSSKSNHTDPMMLSTPDENDSSITYPLGRFKAPHSPNSSLHGQEIQDIQSEEGMPIAPWSYIQKHSETAIDITDNDEMKPSEFALMLTSLENYIASCTASDVKVVIACKDRVQRDTMVLAIRSLAGQSSAATMEERRNVFPWSSASLSNIDTIINDKVHKDKDKDESSPRDYIPSPILADSQIVTIVKADVVQEQILMCKIDHLENEIKIFAKKETDSDFALQQIQICNEELTAETLRLETLCSDKDAQLERSSGISANEEIQLLAERTQKAETLSELERIISEYKDQKIELELLTVNFEDLKVRNAHLAADADQSNNEWNRKEDTFSSQIASLISDKETLIKMDADFKCRLKEEKEVEASLSIAAEQAEVTEMRSVMEELQGEVNLLKRKNESQAKDLKKVIREKMSFQKELEDLQSAVHEQRKISMKEAEDAKAKIVEHPQDSKTKWDKLQSSFHKKQSAVTTVEDKTAYPIKQALMGHMTSIMDTSAHSMTSAHNISPATSQSRIIQAAPVTPDSKNPFGDEDIDNESDDGSNENSEKSAPVKLPSVPGDTTPAKVTQPVEEKSSAKLKKAMRSIFREA
eukprot:CAMPEP_0119052012 /NCGR_PEP_ID=MMETSP1177-20130426/73451_1 /TAXON_ID=2985 /ORGANISM="Ochromonas sp, Strain CCMP1899" /LENGTH=889 /DNA_ID=CAMNT_0007031437 /DNA_START=97 /DNA_END=2766 /DNA_ORIENTATION=-